MAETYTYTARSAEHPERVVTFRLRDSRMSVSLGAPLEQVERTLQIGAGEEEPEAPEEALEEADEVEPADKPKLWLKPMAVSLMERGMRPFHVDDVVAKAADDWLRVKAWIRAGNLRLLPFTLIEGRVDNPDAAHAFIEEVKERKTAAGLSIFDLLDYWATWIVGGILMIVLFQRWRRQAGET